MSIWHCLVEIRPYDSLSGERVPVRLASADLREITGLGGVSWNPAMTEAPKTSIALFGGNFADAVKVGSARIAINLVAARKGDAGIDDYFWPGAGVTIYIGRAGDNWPWTPHFVGKVTAFAAEKSSLALTCEVGDEPFAAEVLNRTFAGTGDAEGSEDLKDRPKPLVIGWAQNVEPVLIDAVDNVYLFSGYGPIEAVDSLYERASDFGDPTGDYADFDALVGADIPNGRWATCLAEGMIRLGAPAAGVITGDVRGHVVGGETPRLTGAVISALAAIAGIDDSLIGAATLAAMDEAVPYPIDLVVSEKIRFIEIARRLALPCNHQVGVSLTGKLFATSVAVLGNGSLELHAQGQRVPQVIESSELPVSPPFGAIMLGANRSWRVHTADEIAFDGPLNPRGSYKPGKTYRYGDIVSSPDQSEWIYINDEPGSGNAPPTWPTTSNDWWENVKGPVTADDIAYSTGDTLEDLKPAEANSDVASNIPNVPETVIQCDYTGAPKAGQLPRNVRFRLNRNGVDVSESAAWSMTVLSGDIDASISDSPGTKGRLTITDADTDAVIEIEADYGGGTAVRHVEHKVSLNLDPGAGGGSNVVAGVINGSASTNTLVAIGSELEITVGAGGEVALAAGYEFATDQVGGSQSAYARWYKWNGSAYVAIGTEQAAGTSYSYLSGSPGIGACNETDSGLTPSAVERYQLFGRSETAGHQTGFSGACSATSN